MNINNKVFHLDSQFTKELPTADQAIDSIYISGYASANSVDRAGDVVPSSVWEKGIQNYLKNPVVLAYHDHDDPVGRMVEHKVDNKGLWVKVRISAASEIFNLVKDGVLTAFSVGFRIKDAEYNAETELFVIKELELIEISVVSVPCNQDTLFSLSKAFDSAEDYTLFKLQFTPDGNVAKGLESAKDVKSNKLKEIGMDPKELQAMLDAAANNAATQATKALLDSQKAAELAKEKAEAEELAMQKRIADAVAKVTPSTTGAEKLLEEVTKRFETESASNKSLLAGLEATLKEKADELAALQRSKMSFGEGKGNSPEYADIEKAVLLGKITKKNIEDTKFGKELVQKYAGSQPSPHLPNSTWDTQVSLNMESDIRRRLVIAGAFTRSVQMDQPVMKIPLNPDATGATWVTNTNYGAAPASLGAAGASAGATTAHQLSEIVLSAYKLANNEYIAYESEEDSLIVLLPLIRDAMVRRLARGVDKAFGLGAGAGADPITGLAKLDAVSAVTKSVAGAGTAGMLQTSDLRLLRKDLGVWGLDPSEVIFIVNTEGYFDLMEDTIFQTMDKVGDKASVLTGQVGMVGGSPVIVSGELPARASGANTGGVLTNVGAIAFNPNNFLVGNQRGVRFDTQDLVETQRKVLVGSLRTGMTQVTTASGLGISAFRWLV